MVAEHMGAEHGVGSRACAVAVICFALAVTGALVTPAAAVPPPSAALNSTDAILKWINGASATSSPA